MKKMMLVLLALIVVPAWAADVAATPEAQTRVNIELKGSAKSVQALVADMEKAAVYKEAICSTKPAKKSGKTIITCAKADSALMDFLSKNAPAKVQWSISVAASCATGCVLMNCPPPGGPLVCCKRTTSGYVAC
jgi:hypothetical protein